MIDKIKETLGQIFHSPEASGTWGDDITVNMDGGVGGSWKVECAIDEEVVDCDEMDSPPYVSIPAPAYLEDDEWFGAAPVKTEKQMEYMEMETKIKKDREQREKEFSIEPDDIHQRAGDGCCYPPDDRVQHDPFIATGGFFAKLVVHFDGGVLRCPERLYRQHDGRQQTGRHGDVGYERRRKVEITLWWMGMQRDEIDKAKQRHNVHQDAAY